MSSPEPGQEVHPRPVTDADPFEEDHAELDDAQELMVTATVPGHSALTTMQALETLARGLPPAAKITHLSLATTEEDQEDPAVVLHVDDRVHLRTSSGSTIGRVTQVQVGDDKPPEVTVEDEPLYGLWFTYPGGPSGWATLNDGRVILGPRSEIVKVSIPGAEPKAFPSPAHPDDLQTAGGLAERINRMFTGKPLRVAHLALPHTTDEQEWTCTT